MDFIDCHPMSLSGGQKQRVVASAIASDRTILILDEPTSIDFKNMKEVSNEMIRLKEDGKLFLLLHMIQN